MHGIENFLLLLLLGLPLVLLFRRLGISALVAYLVAGFLVGEFGLGAEGLGWIESPDLGLLAEIGATLILFSLGLELDSLSMRRQLREILIGAVGQIGSTVLVGALLMWALGVDFSIAIAIGACLALSSTLMVIRALDENKLRTKPAGRMALGLLLTQDIALAPLIALVAFVVPQEHAPHIAVAIGGMVGSLAATWFVRRLLATRVVVRIREAQMPELEVAFSIGVAIGAAWLTESIGLGAALGAFCAGLALGGDAHRHAIETATRPLQGLLAILFFASIGTRFDPGFVGEEILLVATALVVSIALKAALAGFAMRLAGLPVKQAIGAGIMVGQVGEFSFVIAASFANSPDPNHQFLYNLVVAVSCLSLAATPFLVLLAMRFLPRSNLNAITGKSNTILIAGLGPVGHTVVETLHGLGYHLFLVDRNEKLLETWKDHKRITLHKGKIEDMEDWLPALGSRPKLVVLTYPVADTSALVAERLRAMEPSLVIVARAPYIAQVEPLHQSGAQYVICDERATAEAFTPLLTEALAQGFEAAQETAPEKPLDKETSGEPETKSFVRTRTVSRSVTALVDDIEANAKEHSSVSTDSSGDEQASEQPAK